MLDTATASGSRGAASFEGPEVAQEPAEWHVILPAGQIGPLPLSALIQKMVGGEMPARSFVWRDGMDDWKRAAEVPEVARWLPASRPGAHSAAAPAPAAVGVTPAPAPSGRSRSGIVDAAAERFFEADPHAEPSHTPSAPQPILHVDTAPELTSSRAGELTKFFITQAHVSRGRSWWAVLAFGLGTAVLLVGGILGLAELGVPVPLVEQAPSSQPKVFTGAEGDSRIRDLLYGHRKATGSPGGGTPHRGVASSPSDPGAAPNQGPLATRAEQHVDQLGKSDKDQLSRLYASQDLSNLKLKQSANALPVLDRPDAPLTAEQVSRTVAKFQTGYTRCVDGELKRNPSFPGGKIRIVTTIMSSGLVRQAQIVSDDAHLQRAVIGSPLGTCLSEQTRRMVFPSFQGEPFDAEIPLVLSSAL
jgi:hypothetical protein